MDRKINSLSEYIAAISDIRVQDNEVLFFRGESDVNYILIPSVLRSEKSLKEEDEVYHSIMVDFPEKYKSNNHLGNLVNLQHYGANTRLLDLSRNMLASLYFASEESFDTDGRVWVFKLRKKDVLHHNSDRALMLSCLPPLSYEDKLSIKRFCQTHRDVIKDDDIKYDIAMKHLLHEIRREFPAFDTCIVGQDLLDCFCVAANKNNERMFSQDGAFFIFGLEPVDLTKKECLLMEIIINKSSKKKIIEDLSLCGLTTSAVYPGFERKIFEKAKSSKLSPKKI